jgi:ADP-ribosyl-[dinitrogen reductase] hydrolase
MALCLANSLIARRDFVPYDQLVRYKWWHKDGYMSSTGKCFDIGAATKQALAEFERRQNEFAQEHKIPSKEMDSLSDPDLLGKFDVYCSREGVAGNGALMRLAPVPLFFQKNPLEAVAFSGFSGVISHGDRIAFDACRYYGALIVAAVHGLPKEELLDNEFYLKHEGLFNKIPIHSDIMKIAKGSFKEKGGYDKGIRGKGYIVNALEAALWAFWSEDSFEKGALAAVNLGDDTDTTAAIYGQLAGACYGYQNLPEKWLDDLYAIDFIKCVSKWIAYEGQRWQPGETYISTIPSFTFQLQANAASDPSSEPKENQKQDSDTDKTGTSLINTAAPEAAGCGSGSNHHSLRYLRSIYSSLRKIFTFS